MLKNGTSPLAFRLSHKSKVLTIATGFYLSEQQWSDSSFSKSAQLRINELQVKIDRAIFKLEDRLIPFSVHNIKALIVRKTVTNSFSDYLADKIAALTKVERVGSAKAYQCALNSLSTYRGDNIQFADLNFRFLTEYDNWLTTRGVKINSIGNYMRSIRAVYNQAVNEDIVGRETYPFGKYKIRAEPTEKRALTPEDLHKLMNHWVFESDAQQKALDVFKLVFSLVGINLADLATLTSKNIVGGRLHYRRKKTKKLYDIKLTSMALELIDKLKSTNTGYLLNILDKDHPDPSKERIALEHSRQLTNKALNRLAVSLNLSRRVTIYVARHSWATTAKRIGYSNELIAESLGHEHGNRITNIYLDKYDKEVIDGVNESVLDSLF